MKTVVMVKCLAVSWIAAASIGCAPAYRCYTDCYVECQYCPRPPLPYHLYDECVCHSCVAEKYLENRPVAPSAASDVKAPTLEEAP